MSRVLREFCRHFPRSLGASGSASARAGNDARQRRDRAGHRRFPRLPGVLACWCLTFIMVGAGPARGAEADDKRELITPELRERSVAILRETLAKESRWIKVHAAEYLLQLSYPQGVHEAFEAELAAYEQEPKYRVGIWRVLAQAATSVNERNAWIERIRSVVLDPAATDHVHAWESLAKLGDRLDTAELKQAATAAAAIDRPTAPYAQWLLASSGDSTELKKLANLLNSDNPDVRLVAAYGLQWLRVKDAAIQKLLAEVAEHEPADSSARPYLLSAAWTLAADASSAAMFRNALLTFANSTEPGARAVASSALAIAGDRTDVAGLQNWVADADADTRAAAAAALLRIGRRGTHYLESLDWTVIALYFVSMLAIGWYYSYRTETADEYLLGGRTMKSWTVGLSLFATLCSTITYLSTPGEMIQHGPMFLASMLCFPIVMIVVDLWLIPFFMRLPVTSAYEILETRLGFTVRMLGAIFFLAMRLLWMAVILHVTSIVVLLPLLGLDKSYSPYLCALLGLTTVIYSSMGGLRAVVMTDVVQTFILLGGAIAALGLITWNLGGIGAWWPMTWAPNWDPPELGLDPNSRMSFLNVTLSTLVWYICTSGSDQMAIQRYLSTRDVRAARRMFDISMIAGGIVITLLGLLGFALLAWFRAHPEFLGEGQSVANNADQLFPRYIAASLPDGFGGLVVAGLLAAAMSSLSSGLSSSCAVITVDFWNRLSAKQPDAVTAVRRARYISWTVGICVVILSTMVGLIPGTVLDLAYKVVNLLTAPLFGLFFMALFVSWATGFGTLVGAAAGLATVVVMSYWPEYTGISFMWAMPVSLLVQIAVGMVASLLPIGTAKPLIRPVD